MITGTGIDIVSIDRFEKMFTKHEIRFKKKFFTQQEIIASKNKITFFAGRFTAKEAISKALGCGFGQKLKWLDLEILPNKNGKPVLTKNNIITNLVGTNFECFISISHEKNYAVSNAIICLTQDKTGGL